MITIHLTFCHTVQLQLCYLVSYVILGFNLVITC